MKPVPSVEPDYTRCRAVVLLSGGFNPFALPGEVGE
jgi:hypothetical protein